MVVIISNIILSILDMKKKDIIVLGLLIALTIITAMFATMWYSIKNVATIIMILSAIKFLLVAFQFIELKKAHVFWKIILVGYLTIFLIITTVIMNA